MTLSLAIIWLLSALFAPAAQESGITLGAQAGFDGYYRNNAAVPLVVTARNDGPAVDGEIRVLTSRTGSGPIYSAPIALPTGSDKRLALVVHPPAFSGQLVIQLVSDGRVLEEISSNRLNSIAQDELLYGVVSPEPGGLAFLETIPGNRNDADVAFLDAADLPEVSSAWNALDVLIFDDTDTSRLTAGQLAALHAWLESGGQLVVTGGPGGLRTAAALDDLLPVAVRGVESFDALPALSEHAGLPYNAAGPFVVAAGELRSGESLIQQDGLPLLARRELGRGSVTFLALDPKLPPLAGWGGNELLWAEIATNVPERPPWAAGIQEGYAAEQAISFVPGLSLPSAWQLFLFLALYIAIIGPINFLVLRRMNRRELAWITIPALVLLFSAITFFTGFRTRGNATTANVMTVAYGSAEAERLRAESLLGLYSPRRAAYDIVLPYDATIFPFSSSSGMQATAGSLEAIGRAADVTLHQVRTDTSEVATFVIDSHLARPAISTEANLSSNGRQVEVTVRNNTGVTLENAVVIYGRNQSRLGNVAPGASQSVTITLPVAAAGESAAEETVATPTPNPMFSPGFTWPNPLMNDPSLILGTSNYYNDPVAYPRWQLLQSHYSYSDNPLDALRVPDPTELVTLAGWLAESEQEVAVAGVGVATHAQTLLLLEIPVR